MAFAGMAPQLTRAETAPGYDVFVIQGNAALTGVDCGNEVCWNGGGGSFSKNNISCTGIISDPDELLPGCAIGSFSGNFSTIVCGTGTVTNGLAGSIVEQGDAGSANASYGITFIGGLGILTGTAFEPNDNGIGTYPANLAGLVLLSPPGGTGIIPPNPNAPHDGSCVTSFDFHGVIVVLDNVGQP
jgi:hypothetical protein